MMHCVMIIQSAFGFEHMADKFAKIFDKPSMIEILTKLQVCYSVMCGYLYAVFIIFMLVRKSLSYYDNLLSPRKCKTK